MKTILSMLTVILASAAIATAEESLEPKPVQTGKGHRFACTDYSGQKVFLVNEDGKVEWEYKTGHCNDLWVLPNDNILFNTGNGVLEVNRNKETVFEYKSKGEVYACQRLPDGNTLIGECSLGKLIEVAPDGTVIKELKIIPEGENGGHAYIRNVRKLANGNYLVAHYGAGMVKEYDPEGVIVWECVAPGGPHSVARLSNGNTIIAEGDKQHQARIFEVDRNGNTVWEVKHNELPGISLKFMTGFHRLPNGNTVMSNWVGHGQFGKAPHIIEVTPDKRVVWTFEDHITMKTISHVQILDVPGDATKYEIIH